MRIYKLTDLCIQLIILAISVCCILLDATTFVYGYAILGGYQVLSVLIHLLARRHYVPGSLRRKYEQILPGALLGLIPGLLLLYPFALMALLAVAPVLAAIYIAACRQELVIIRHRRFIHMK